MPINPLWYAIPLLLIVGLGILPTVMSVRAWRAGRRGAALIAAAAAGIVWIGLALLIGESMTTELRREYPATVVLSLQTPGEPAAAERGDPPPPSDAPASAIAIEFDAFKGHGVYVARTEPWSARLTPGTRVRVVLSFNATMLSRRIYAHALESIDGVSAMRTWEGSWLPEDLAAMARVGVRVRARRPRVRRTRRAICL